MLLNASARLHWRVDRAGGASVRPWRSETAAGAAVVPVLMSVASFHRVEQVGFGDLLAGQLRGDDAATQDEDACAHAEEVALVRGRDDHAEAGTGLLGDQVVELHAGADIDARRRLAKC